MPKYQVAMLIEHDLSVEQRELIENIDKPSMVTDGRDNTTCIGIRQEAPTGPDAINRVGAQLRKLLGMSDLNVIEVQARRFKGKQ